MRKLIVSMNITLDGFMADPDSGLDWHFQNWNREMAQAVNEQLSDSDTILLGRVTYNAMAGYWSSRPMELASTADDRQFAEMINNHEKVVFSRTLPRVDWLNTRLATAPPSEEVPLLKRQEGKELLVYGSGKIVTELTRLKLIDEYRMWVHPVAIGKGRPLFKGLCEQLNLELVKTRIFSSGVVLLHYHSRKSFCPSPNAL